MRKSRWVSPAIPVAMLCLFMGACKHEPKETKEVTIEKKVEAEKPEYFSLRPKVEKEYGYTRQFPTGSWFGVKELALPEFMIEIELEVYKP